MIRCNYDLDSDENLDQVKLLAYLEKRLEAF